MRRALLLLACVGGAAAIHSVTLDTDGKVAATAALAAGAGAAGVGVIQGVNLPYVLSTEITLKKGDSANSMGAYWRTTKETSFKAYVKCAGLSSSSSTYSLSYTLDGSASATVGTDFTSTSNPFVMVESLDDGMHTLIVTCTDSSGNDELYPMTFNWKVDTTTSSEVVFDKKPAYYSNSLSPRFDFHSSIPSSAAVSAMSWTCSFTKDGTEDFQDCDVASGVSSSETASASEEGTWEFVAKLTIAYDTTCTASDYYCSDLVTKVDRNSYTFRIDTTAPVVDVTSSPSAKSQYTSGKTATFEFECPASEISCTFQCLVDGYDSADATSSSRSKGSFACTSPTVITVANSTTHSFAVQATDASSNTGSWTSLYMFYADGTPPTVEFTKMDDSVSYTSQKLASGATYYASSNDYNIATGGRLYESDGSTFAVLDEQNYNANDTSWAANDQSVVQYTDGNGVSSTTVNLANDVTAKSTYHTVLQFPYDPTKGVYELDGTYGAILAMKKVNDRYYYNVLDTTNADFGTINYRCKHPEMF
jgi:hypothetical protein